jgi:hypothetical protein
MAMHSVARTSVCRAIHLHCLNMAASLYHKCIPERYDIRASIPNHHSLLMTVITLYCREMVFKGKRLIYTTTDYEHNTSQHSKLPRSRWNTYSVHKEFITAHRHKSTDTWSRAELIVDEYTHLLSLLLYHLLQTYR